MSDPITAFIDHMRAVGCAPSGCEIIDDDKTHRYHIDGDKPRTLNGSYKLKVEPDGFAVGWCMSFREGVLHPWHVRSKRTATPEERDAWKRRSAEAKARREREAADAAAEAASRAKSLWKRADTTGSAGYLDRKRLTDLHGARIMRGMVVVPCWTGAGLTSLQFIAPDGQKRFLRNGSMDGAYHAIPGDDVLVICEGYATGCKIHIATGHSVICAFNAGNLKAVAVSMRRKYPDRRIVIGADNDQWTTRPDGTLYNAGMVGAQAAAVAIGGAMVVAPDVPEDDPARRTDWDDVHDSDGPDVVREAFARALHAHAEPVGDDTPIGDTWEPVYEPVAHDGGLPDNPVLRAVHPLGRIGKIFYFFPRHCGQIMDFSGPALASIQNLVTMAPRWMWESNFDAKSGEKKMASEASLMLIEACNMVGIYDPETERGVGMWGETDGAVLNGGDRLYHRNGDCLPPDYQSNAVYVMGPRVGRITDDQMTNQDAAEILKICLSLSWKHRQAGYMLAGWIVTALAAGALRWRSHIVLTGEPGAGKSWVIDNIIKPLLGRLGLSRDGGTTEAKLRVEIGSTARPVVMDESESETQKDRINMEQIFMLARKASSGSNVANFNGVYPIRSSFCFAAINPRIIQGADLDRNSILHLVKSRSPQARDEFRTLERRVSAAITHDAAERLLSRIFHNLPVLLRNIETFSDALTRQEGVKRFGDQFGTLVAGAFLLTSIKEISADDAAEWCAKQDWTWTKADNDQSEGEKLLAFILSARVRYDDRGMAREASVGRLIDRALHGDGLDRDAAIAALGEYGIRADQEWLCIGTPCKPMMDVLRETQWGGSYRRMLGEISGAEQRDKMRFNPSMRLRAVAIPMRHVIGDDPPQEEELPFWGDGFK